MDRTLRWEPKHPEREGMVYAVAYREAKAMGYSQADAREYAEREVARRRAVQDERVTGPGG